MVEVPNRIHATIVTLNVVTIVRGDILQENVERRRMIIGIMEKCNRITMHLLPDMINVFFKGNF